MQSLANHSGLIATVTSSDGTIAPTVGNQSWFEYGARLGLRITQGWVADLFPYLAHGITAVRDSAWVKRSRSRLVSPH